MGILDAAMNNVMRDYNNYVKNTTKKKTTTEDENTETGSYSNTTGTPTGTQVVVNSDTIDGGSRDKKRIQTVCDALNNAGYKAIASGVGPQYHTGDIKRYDNSYIVCIVGGLCAGTIVDYGSKWFQLELSKHNNKVGQALYEKYSKYKGSLDNLKFLERAWDDNFSGGSFKGIDNPAQYLREHNVGYCNGGLDGSDEDLAQAVVRMVQTGVGVGGNASGSTATVTEGAIHSARGDSPQFWNLENYHFPIETRFTNFEIQEENPRIRTATFESPDNIDLTEGRVAVLITGDCNDFGGIIIKKTHDSKSGIYKYQCQGFLDRILSNTVYVVANGSKTAWRLIYEFLADVGLPSTCLGSEDDYDVAVTEDTLEKMKADAELTETSELFLNQEDASGTTTRKTNTSSSSSNNNNSNNSNSSGSNNSNGSSSSATSGGSSTSNGEGKPIKTVTETLASTEDGKIKNTFKRKPVGIFDKKTGGEYIRTLIFDYGINVDFYGDINGVPHFDVLDLDTWKRTGWYLSPDMGFEEDYQYEFDITNVVTQVGVKNIQAINGNGEMYTSGDLLGVNVENYVGRMGTVVDNPSERGSTGKNSEKVEQIKTKYQDASGREYKPTEVIDTNGEPSCPKCTYKNGGQQPEQKKYQKSWLNKCPACEETGKLKNITLSDPHGKTVCSSCNKEYCQYCGFERDQGKYQLTEIFKVIEKTGDNKKLTDSDTGETQSVSTAIYENKTHT